MTDKLNSIPFELNLFIMLYFNFTLFYHYSLLYFIIYILHLFLSFIVIII